MKVSGHWIKQHVKKLYGLFDVSELENYINLDDKFQTTLTYKGLKCVEDGLYTKKFTIVLTGHGLVGVKGYSDSD